MVGGGGVFGAMVLIMWFPIFIPDLVGRRNHSPMNIKRMKYYSGTPTNQGQVLTLKRMNYEKAIARSSFHLPGYEIFQEWERRI